MIILVIAIGGFLGRFIIGFPLNYFLKSEERDDPNPENLLGGIGSVFGAIIAVWLYHG